MNVTEVLTSRWIGKSGTEYSYYVWKLPVLFDDGKLGNYIFAKIDKLGVWVPVFIGHGDLKEATSNHPQAGCIARMGASHIHTHLNLSASLQEIEEKDLLEMFPTTLKPNGCNLG